MALVMDRSAVAQIERPHCLAAPALRHIQDALATERDNQRMIEEVLLEVMTVAADTGWPSWITYHVQGDAGTARPRIG
jgi:hypothetical protein